MNETIKTLRVTGKTSDLCSVQGLSANGNCLVEHDGYVPDLFPGQHYGDYLELHIDVVTGQILNWPKDLTQEQIWKDLQRP